MALLQVEFFSHVLHMAVGADVILPQKTSREAGKSEEELKSARYPVLWLLHGASDDQTTWHRRTNLESFAAERGLAVVMPSALLSSYANMVHGGRFYDYISEELPRIMRGFFPISEKREDNFIAGNSMGGYGAMKIGISRPDRYAAIGCFSAGANNARFIAERFRGRRPRMREEQEMIYGDEPYEKTLEDTWYMAEKNRDIRPLPRIYHTCGTEDFLLDKARATRDFFESLPGNPYQYVYEEFSGAHTWDFWDAHISGFLDRICPIPAKGADGA